MQDAPQPVAMNDKSKGSGSKEGTGDQCRFCLSRDFKRSRLHANDLFTILRMKVPARCVRCGQLQKISFKTARRSLPPGANSETGQALSPAMQPVALSASAAGRTMSVNPEIGSRAAIPHAMLMDPLDIRCQYCPGQAFRRSRLRLPDLWLILGMRYSARCLRCGQRQTVNYMVAGASVPSYVKQARSLRNTETWRDFTISVAPELQPLVRATPQPPVIAQVYALKDVPFDETGDVFTPPPVAPVVVVEPAPAPVKPAVSSKPVAPAAKRPVDDHSIW